MYVNQPAGLNHHSASSSQPNIQFMFNMPLVHFVCNSSQVFFFGGCILIFLKMRYVCYDLDVCGTCFGFCFCCTCNNVDIQLRNVCFLNGF